MEILEQLKSSDGSYFLAVMRAKKMNQNPVYFQNWVLLFILKNNVIRLVASIFVYF